MRSHPVLSKEEPMAENGDSSRRGEYIYVLPLILILVGIAWVGLRPSDNREASWLIILVMLAAFLVITGRGVTGYWRGILIDSRYKMSLSRLQFVVWTLLVLSGLLSAAMLNLASGSDAPLNFEIPQQLFVLMGISTASLVASPAVLSSKARERKADKDELKKTSEKLKKEGYEDITESTDSVVVRNPDASSARWADLIKGEEVGNATTVDLGKMQMLFFTFILALAYAGALSALFGNASGVVTTLPPIDDGMNVLLGISHTGYLSSKAVTYSRPPTQDE